MRAEYPAILRWMIDGCLDWQKSGLVRPPVVIEATAELSGYNRGRTSPSRMILTVHDELLFEVPESEAETVAELVRETMQQAFPLAVPLTVDVGVGRNWKEAK